MWKTYDSMYGDTIIVRRLMICDTQVYSVDQTEYTRVVYLGNDAMKRGEEGRCRRNDVKMRSELYFAIKV